MASDQTRILMFHRVLEEFGAAFGLPDCYRIRGTALTLPEFDRVLDDAGPILSLQEIEQALRLGVPPPAGSVLTFDDGYREHLDIVAPLLTARGAVGTFYVAAGLHGAGSTVAIVDSWYWLLDHASQPVGRVVLPDGTEFYGRVDTLEGKRTWVGGEPKGALLAATPAEQARMLGELADSLACALPKDLAARLYLRTEEWSTLQTMGMRVGAHSVTHPRLTQLDSVDLTQEVEASVETIRASGVQAVAFAYPDGVYNTAVLQAVRTAGVSSAVTCEVGEVQRGSDLHRLPRMFVHPSCVPSSVDRHVLSEDAHQDFTHPKAGIELPTGEERADTPS